MLSLKYTIRYVRIEKDAETKAPVLCELKPAGEGLMQQIVDDVMQKVVPWIRKEQVLSRILSAYEAL